MKNPTARNAILIVVDTLRPDLLGCYGGAGGLTPNIDRLAERGVLFTQAITSGTWTQAAMPGILTSTFASMYNGCLGKLDENRPSPVERLLDSGYATGAFVSNPLIGLRFGYDRGFETFEEIQTNERDPGLRKRRGGQLLLRSKIFQTIGKRIGADLRPAKVYPPGEKIVDAAIRWLSGVDAPFFGWLHFMDVHWPYHLETDIRSPAGIAGAWRDLHHFHEAGWRGASFNKTHHRHYLDLYKKALAYLDAQIGRLIDSLESRGLLKDTTLLLTADHGEEFLEHGRWGHWEDNLHEEILRVPMILRHPGGSGARIDAPVQTLDVFPTLLDVLGEAAPDGMLGTSLADRIAEPGAGGPRLTFTELQRKDWHKIALRMDGIKYIWDNKAPEEPVIYDLRTDPQEKRPLQRDRLPDWPRFQEKIDGHLAMIAGSSAQAGDLIQDADEELLDRLRRLGYVA